MLSRRQGIRNFPLDRGLQLIWKEPDVEGVVAFMCGEKSFAYVLTFHIFLLFFGSCQKSMSVVTILYAKAASDMYNIKELTEYHNHKERFLEMVHKK